jgi:hypothetical protein
LPYGSCKKSQQHVSVIVTFNLLWIRLNIRRIFDQLCLRTPPQEKLPANNSMTLLLMFNSSRIVSISSRECISLCDPDGREGSPYDPVDC